MFLLIARSSWWPNKMLYCRIKWTPSSDLQWTHLEMYKRAVVCEHVKFIQWNAMWATPSQSAPSLSVAQRARYKSCLPGMCLRWFMYIVTLINWTHEHGLLRDKCGDSVIHALAWYVFFTLYCGSPRRGRPNAPGLMCIGSMLARWSCMYWTTPLSFCFQILDVASRTHVQSVMCVFSTYR